MDNFDDPEIRVEQSKEAHIITQSNEQVVNCHSINDQSSLSVIRSIK